METHYLRTAGGRGPYQTPDAAKRLRQAVRNGWPYIGKMAEGFWKVENFRD